VPTATENELPIANQILPYVLLDKHCRMVVQGMSASSASSMQHFTCQVFVILNIICCNLNNELLPSYLQQWLLTLQEGICITLAVALHISHSLPYCV